MNVTSDMYTKLFNELTDIMKDLENIKERIKKVQSETEEIYINKRLSYDSLLKNLFSVNKVIVAYFENLF